MILSSVLCSSTLVYKGFSAFLNKAFSFLGICIKYSSVLIFGNISGFIVGPKLLSEEIDLNFDKSETTRLILLSSNAGIGFVVSFVGQTIFKNFLFGLAIYIFQILTSFILNSLIFFKRKNCVFSEIKYQRKPFLTSITDSISKTTSSKFSSYVSS